MLWRQISNDVGQHNYIYLNGRILLNFIQGSLTGLRCRDKIVCPLIQRVVQAMGPGATLCRPSMPLQTELRSSQIYCHPLSRFGSRQFLNNEQLKTAPPLLMCTSSPMSCSRCGRVNSSDPRPPHESVLHRMSQIMAAIPAVDCHEHESHL